MDASILNYTVNDNVAKFLNQTHKLYINGKWVDSKSGKTFDVEDPATGKKISTCAAGDKNDIDLAVSAARKCFDSGKWHSVPPNEKGKIIWKIAELIDDHTEELAQLESLDNGKPVAIAAGADVALSSDIFRYMAGWATKIEGETIPISVPYTPGAQYHSYTLREPVGVVGQIIPWNFPLLMAAGISKIASNIKVGPGMDSSSEMGPLVSDEQFKKVSGYIESGKSEGGEIIAGGKYDNSSGGHFVHPTVFAKTDKDMSIVKEEIFGPVLCAQPFSDQDLDKIAEVANNTTFGLAASVWSQNISTAHKLAAKIRAGTVWVNCHNIFDASLPFGGYKESGWGREMGHEVLKNYTELKAVTVNL